MPLLKVPLQISCEPLQSQEGKIFLEPSLLHEQITPHLSACFIGEMLQPSEHLHPPPLHQSVSDLALLPMCNLIAADILQAGCSYLEGPGRLKVSELHLHSSHRMPRAVALLWSTGTDKLW